MVDSGMTNWIDGWILTWLVFLPVLGALPVLLMSERRPGLIRAWSLAVTLITVFPDIVMLLPSQMAG